MAKTTVKAEIAVPAEKLWALVRDFGSVPWIPGGDVASVEGEGVGMVRILAGGAIREQLLSVDEPKMQIGYTVVEGLPVPATDYHATMTIESRGADRCELDWSCTYVPSGASDEEVGAQFEGLYEMMIGWIKDQLGAS